MARPRPDWRGSSARRTNLYALLFDCHDQLVEVPLGGAEAPAHWPCASDVTDIAKVLAAGIHQHQLACPVRMQRISSPTVPLRWFKKIFFCIILSHWRSLLLVM